MPTDPRLFYIAIIWGLVWIALIITIDTRE